MWSKNAWDDIKMYFPEDNNGSRIIVTTREADVANYVGSLSPQHQMHFLNQSESWNLLQQKVFGKKNCPVELERIGQKIASSCKGLPLAIHVVGGLLSKEKRTIDFWKHVAHDISAALGEKDEQFFNILSLSYKHLPNHLRPCFLYMGAFPEDYEIRASKLIRLWVAEGFLKSNGDKSLEEEAEDCLKALVGRNLIMVKRYKSNGKAKSYSIHDLLRELGIRRANKEKFLYCKSQQVHNLQFDLSYCWHRVSVLPSSSSFAAKEFMLLARSFLCTGRRVLLPPVLFKLRLLRVLDVYDIKLCQFPTEILQLVNLRYLALSYDPDLPSAISRFSNLQTLVVRSGLYSIYLPSEIWEMLSLRHFLYEGACIVIRPHNWKDIAQEKLQTISTVDIFHLLETNFVGSIPNIKSLAIHAFLPPSGAVDLHHLHKLETFRCSSSLAPDTRTFLSMLRFPPLRKLTLRICRIPWRFMTAVSSLPNLGVLKILGCAFEGKEDQPEDEQEWEVTEEGFCSLRFLELGYLKLVHWRADETKFRSLCHLVIRGCRKLKEIPSGIGEIPTLELIEVDRFSPSAVDSARQIQANQLELGNEDIQVRIC